MYTQKQHLQLLECPVFNPKYFWTANVLSGLIHYAQYHLKEMMDQTLQGSNSFFLEYKLALQALINDLKAGHFKKCAEAKELANAQRARDDLQAIKNMPSIAKLQHAVRNGYHMLKKIVKHIIKRL